MSKRKALHPNHPAARNPPLAAGIYDRASQPIEWLKTGRQLRLSSQIIFDREGPIATRRQNEWLRLYAVIPPSSKAIDDAEFPVANLDAGYMLLGFAIENFLKGMILAKGKRKFTERQLPHPLNGHVLRVLHELAEPSANISHHLLDHTTVMLEWRARYPMPTVPEKLWRMRPDGGFLAAGYHWPDSFNAMIAYCDGLDAELHALI